MQEIYYVYLKETGEYMGSGTPYYDDETYGCTTTETPEYDYMSEIPYWIDNQWIIKSLT